MVKEEDESKVKATKNSIFALKCKKNLKEQIRNN